MTTKYTFETTPTTYTKDEKRKHRRRSSSDGGEDVDPTDGSGSLTYSAASSINSAGESTDSSFADILRVLDVQGQDTKELAAYLQKERTRKDERSVAESLAYSTDAESNVRSMATDAESNLHGTDFLSTITGYVLISEPQQCGMQSPLFSLIFLFSFFRQPSDQYAYDGGGSYPVAGERQDEAPQPLSGADEDILFAPAEHTDSIKRRKDRKRRERQQNRTPRVKNSQKTAPESRQGTPPTARPPKAAQGTIEMQEEEDVWYAKWWMFCFPDAVKNMQGKR